VGATEEGGMKYGKFEIDDWTLIIIVIIVASLWGGR
jgi:hypothetical protein